MPVRHGLPRFLPEQRILLPVSASLGRLVEAARQGRDEASMFMALSFAESRFVR